jgi:hypothetical protein
MLRPGHQCELGTLASNQIDRIAAGGRRLRQSTNCATSPDGRADETIGKNCAPSSLPRATPDQDRWPSYSALACRAAHFAAAATDVRDRLLVDCAFYSCVSHLCPQCWLNCLIDNLGYALLSGVAVTNIFNNSAKQHHPWTSRLDHCDESFFAGHFTLPVSLRRIRRPRARACARRCRCS